ANARQRNTRLRRVLQSFELSGRRIKNEPAACDRHVTGAGRPVHADIEYAALDRDPAGEVAGDRTRVACEAVAVRQIERARSIHYQSADAGAAAGVVVDRVADCVRLAGEWRDREGLVSVQGDRAVSKIHSAPDRQAGTGTDLQAERIEPKIALIE